MKSVLSTMRSWHGVLALAATLSLVPLTSGLHPAQAKPPRHAPAYGYRRRVVVQRTYRRRRTYPTRTYTYRRTRNTTTRTYRTPYGTTRTRTYTRVRYRR